MTDKKLEQVELRKKIEAMFLVYHGNSTCHASLIQHIVEVIDAEIERLERYVDEKEQERLLTEIETVVNEAIKAWLLMTAKPGEVNILMALPPKEYAIQILAKVMAGRGK